MLRRAFVSSFDTSLSTIRRLRFSIKELDDAETILEETLAVSTSPVVSFLYEHRSPQGQRLSKPSTSLLTTRREALSL